MQDLASAAARPSRRVGQRALACARSLLVRAHSELRGPAPASQLPISMLTWELRDCALSVSASSPRPCRRTRLGRARPGGRAIGVGEPGARAAARVVPVGVAQQVGPVQLVPQARQQRAGGGGPLARLPLRPLRQGTGRHRCLQAHSSCMGRKLPTSRDSASAGCHTFGQEAQQWGATNAATRPAAWSAHSTKQPTLTGWGPAAHTAHLVIAGGIPGRPPGGARRTPGASHQTGRATCRRSCTPAASACARPAPMSALAQPWRPQQGELPACSAGAHCTLRTQGDGHLSAVLERAAYAAARGVMHHRARLLTQAAQATRSRGSSFSRMFISAKSGRRSHRHWRAQSVALGAWSPAPGSLPASCVPASVADTASHDTL